MRIKGTFVTHSIPWAAAGLLLSGLLSGCASAPRSAILDAARDEAVRRLSSTADNPAVLRGPLSRERALEYALQNNTSLNAVRKQDDMACAGIPASYAGYLPKVSLSGAATRLDDELENTETRGSLNQYDGGILLHQSLFRGGASAAERDFAEWNRLYAREQIRAESERVIYDVMDAYDHALLARQLLKVAENAVTSSQSYLENVLLRQKSGDATEYAVLRARVDVSLYQAEMLQQQNRLNRTVTRLLQRIGAAQQSEIELIDELTFIPMQPDFEQAVRDAFRTRPDIRRQQADVFMLQARLRKAQSDYYPKINAFAEQRWGRPDPHATSDDSWGDDYRIGIQAELPLFDGFIRKSAVDEARARVEQSEILLNDAQEKAALDVQQAILRLRDAESFVQTQKMNLTYAREGLRLADAGYAEGINTEIDVTDARTALTKAQGLHYQALYDHTAAVLMFQKATGALTYEPEVEGHEP